MIMSYSLIILFNPMRLLYLKFQKLKIWLNKKKKAIFCRLKISKTFLKFLDLQKMVKFCSFMKTKNKSLLKALEWTLRNIMVIKKKMYVLIEFQFQDLVETKVKYLTKKAVMEHIYFYLNGMILSHIYSAKSIMILYMKKDN